MDAECVFCQIVAGELPADVVLRNEEIVAFNDLNPQAPVHVLVVPARHRSDIGELGGDPETAAELISGIRGVAAELGLTDYRTVFNTGAAAGQSVFHVHAHVLSGRPFGWPPG